MPEKTVHTYCRICLSGCGLEIEVDEAENRILSIEPDRQNPHTWRDFCRKGKTANEIVEHPRRITTPMRRVGDHYEPATYAEALTDIAARLNTIIDRDGPDAVGTYHGNPMGFSYTTTSYWTGLLDAIGTGNRFWVGSIDQNNSHVVGEGMYGMPLVSVPPDIDGCEFFLLVGMDPAVSKFNWLDNCPDGWNRILARQREDNAEIVVVDPRRSRTAALSGTHLAVLPGQDWAVLLGLVKVILDEGLETMPAAFGVNGLDAVRDLAAQADLDDLSSRCGIPADEIQDVARRFAKARTAVCLSHTGVSHNEFGTVGEWLQNVLNIITNRVDVRGCKRFERGPVDMQKILDLFSPPSSHRTRLRDTPTILGFHALSELPAEITTPGPGQIKAMIVAFGNPVTSGPDGKTMDEAFEQLDLLVSVDFVQRESHRHADWLIPGTHWLEREELNPLFPNLQERPFIQYAHKAIEKPEGVMEEWEFFSALAFAMGRNLFGKPGVNRFIKATEKLAEKTGRPGLAMNPEWMQRGMLAMGRRVKWKDVLSRPHGFLYDEPRYGDFTAAINTPDKKVQLAPPAILAAGYEALASRAAISADFPFYLTNKRSRESMNSWLNESPGMWKLGRENAMEIDPADAQALGISDGDLVRVSSPLGSIEIEAAVSEGVRAGVVCIPHGWGTRMYDPQGGSEPVSYGTNRNLLTDGVRLDRLSQTPAFNATPVSVTLVEKRAAPAPEVGEAVAQTA